METDRVKRGVSKSMNILLVETVDFLQQSVKQGQHNQDVKLKARKGVKSLFFFQREV